MPASSAKATSEAVVNHHSDAHGRAQLCAVATCYAPQIGSNVVIESATGPLEQQSGMVCMSVRLS